MISFNVKLDISFNVKLDRVIRTLFLHNDMVSPMQDLFISGNKKNTPYGEFQIKITPL